jgi:hypothetical protein
VAARRLWSSVERSATTKKIGIICGFDETGTDVSWLQALEPIFRLRNRLMHFRDDDVAVAAPSAEGQPESLIRWFKELPEAELVAELRQPRIAQIADELLAARSRLEAIYHKTFPLERIVVADTTRNPDAVSQETTRE